MQNLSAQPCNGKKGKKQPNIGGVHYYIIGMFFLLEKIVLFLRIEILIADSI